MPSWAQTKTEQEAIAAIYRQGSMSADSIARMYGAPSRNAVIGLMNRMGVSSPFEKGRPVTADIAAAREVARARLAEAFDAEKARRQAEAAQRPADPPARPVPAPTPAPAPAAPQEADVPAARAAAPTPAPRKSPGVLLVDLAPRCCRFSIGQDEAGRFLFCGEVVEPDARPYRADRTEGVRPYCNAHAVRCYRGNDKYAKPDLRPPPSSALA